MKILYSRGHKLKLSILSTHMRYRKRDKRLLPMGSCRGRDKKEQILDTYKLIELFHGVSLNDRIRGCCEETALTEFHRFDFQMREGQNRPDLDKRGVMYVGNHCAAEFRKLMVERGEGHEWPSLFNPLKVEATNTKFNRSSGAAAQRRPQVTTEAETILALMMVSFPTVAEKPGLLLGIYNEIRDAPQKRIYDPTVQSINTAIGNYLKRVGVRKSFLDVVQERAAARDEVSKDFQFPAFSQVLESRGQQDNIHS